MWTREFVRLIGDVLATLFQMAQHEVKGGGGNNKYIGIARGAHRNPAVMVKVCG